MVCKSGQKDNNIQWSPGKYPNEHILYYKQLPSDFSHPFTYKNRGNALQVCTIILRCVFVQGAMVLLKYNKQTRNHVF